VVQCEWTAKNLRATLKNSTSVDDVMYSRMIAYPFRLLSAVTDGGEALILTSADRAKDFDRPARWTRADARYSSRTCSASPIMRAASRGKHKEPRSCRPAR
jgi:acetyl-CoA acetyltransferase